MINIHNNNYRYEKYLREKREELMGERSAGHTCGFIVLILILIIICLMNL